MHERFFYELFLIRIFIIPGTSNLYPVIDDYFLMQRSKTKIPPISRRDLLYFLRNY